MHGVGNPHGWHHFEAPAWSTLAGQILVSKKLTLLHLNFLLRMLRLVNLRQSQGKGSAAMGAMWATWVLSALTLALWLLPEAAQAYTSYTVGDTLGWRLLGAPNYTAWAANHNYNLGDSLVFKFELNHSVVFTLDKPTYDACNFTDGDNFTEFARPGVDTSVNYTLVNLGMNYFGCPTNVSQHCRLGMKFAVNVSFGVGLPPAPPAAPPAPERTVPPPPDTDSPPDIPSPPNGGGRNGKPWLVTWVAATLVSAGLLVVTC